MDYGELIKALEDARDTLEWVYGCTEPDKDEIERAIEKVNETLRIARGET